ncbi:MAG TPA: hypothetical protein GXX37_00960 [Clostridiaceae bacterium]|nr:hypothetical protein [Clostridiaceae bacterium]
MENLIFAPPIVFVIFVGIFILLSRSIKRYSYNSTGKERESGAYACGQQNVRNYVNPDYTQFFPYAFFYTIMHVLVLVIATAPYDALVLPIVYIAAGILALIIIFRK